MTSIIPEYVTIHNFSTKFKTKSIHRNFILFGLYIFNRHSQLAFRARIRPFPFASGQP